MPVMSLLIDGYNLLHVTGIFGANGPAERAFERARHALLDFLAARLTAEVLAKTTVVFDAADAPPGLPSEIQRSGVRALFAPRKSSADEVLEQLIRADHAPRRLTVVSSDHRVQRAARRRNATAVDSDVWFRNLARSAESPPPEDPLAKPAEFDLANPFPPGYAEDLLHDAHLPKLQSHAPSQPHAPRPTKAWTERKKKR
ncbi:MAG TPA: NYN domain-containing protein [Pirellulaceae bacterium]|nr:NYN domain-containing protein [Pirellulaceae bacterium]